MKLNKDVLLKNGFKVDYPDRALCTFILKNDDIPKYNISIFQQYKSYSNQLILNVDCWLCNDKGIIIKNASLTNIETLEELQKIIDLCNINITLKY